MRTTIKIADTAGVIGIITHVAVNGAVMASGSMGDSSMNGPTNHMGGMADCGKDNGLSGNIGDMSAGAGAQCQNGNMMNGQGHMNMVNGKGHQCQNADMQCKMAQNADGTMDCPCCQTSQETA
jgi:hypothetical protein